MGGEKQGSKSGRYVGGFLQLFDWNAKSRKKLFPNRSDLPEQPKQGKKSEGNFPVTRMRVDEDGEFGAGSSVRGGSEYSYASSLTDDDLYGTKPPGVVARLMGLDSMPTTSGADLYPSPFFDTLSLQDAPCRGRRNLEFFRDNQVMHSSHMSDKGDSRPRTMPSRPIEKFQSEMLPPRSAKTIPITHHKLLSPIKSPIFVSSRDSVHIMEAAAKIIEPGPPQATSRAKISSVGSSSVPFKVREMREKLEAAQAPGKAAEHSHRQVESNTAKYLRGQPTNKSWNGGTVEAVSVKASSSRDENSSAAKSKGKSISLAIQAKVNVQKREGLISSRSLTSDEQDDARSSVKSSNRSSALRQNNQKQNCAPQLRDKPTSKISVTNSTGKKAVTKDVSSGRNRSLTREGGASRTNSRKSGDKGTPYSGARNVPRKKRSIDGSLSYDRNEVTDCMPVKKHENASQFAWIEENRRKGMDVVSFSFSAPITRSSHVSEAFRQMPEKSSAVFTDSKSKTLRDSAKLSSSGFNGLRGDALSILLEQKLKELASNLGNPHSFVNTTTPGSVESGTGKGREKSSQEEFRVDGMSSELYSGLSSEFQSIRRTFNFQAGEAVDDYSINTETKQWNPHLPSPVSILEPSMLTESCYSSESLVSSSTEESKHCSSILAQEVVGLSSSTQKSRPMEIDMDTSDSASSTSTHTKDATTKTIAWELGYVKNILCNVELMFKDYVTGRTREIVNPHLFDQMERRTLAGVVGSKLERKVLFDCVGECLDLKCQRFVGGGFEMYMKGITTLKRTDRVAEEVYKEIQGWKRLGNCMVDELVDKDMSNKYGRWLDFEVDEFMLGVEIEAQIVDSLLGEIVVDLLP